MARALIVVDLQNDFLPGGALAVAEGDEVIPIANRLIESGEYEVIVFTQDWHPRDHGSFASNAKVPLFSTFKLNDLNQVAWPDHCVQETKGAEFSADLILSPVKTPSRIFRKGMNPEVDSYSGFFDNWYRAATPAEVRTLRTGDTGLNTFLKQRDISEVDVLGLATDYCVKYTVLDALALGHKVRVIEQGCRAVGGPEGQVKALEEMARLGAQVIL